MGQHISEGVRGTCDEIVDSAVNMVRLWMLNGQRQQIDLQSLGISKERMDLARLHSSILIFPK